MYPDGDIIRFIKYNWWWDITIRCMFVNICHFGQTHVYNINKRHVHKIIFNSFRIKSPIAQIIEEHFEGLILYQIGFILYYYLHRRHYVVARSTYYCCSTSFIILSTDWFYTSLDHIQFNWRYNYKNNW